MKITLQEYQALKANAAKQSAFLPDQVIDALVREYDKEIPFEQQMEMIQVALSPEAWEQFLIDMLRKPVHWEQE